LLLVAVLPIAALAGCAADASRMRTGSVAGAQSMPDPLRAIVPAGGPQSEHEAEMVIAQAIAQHEMRRP
jgi:hypothetical protein